MSQFSKILFNINFGYMFLFSFNKLNIYEWKFTFNLQSFEFNKEIFRSLKNLVNFIADLSKFWLSKKI